MWCVAGTGRSDAWRGFRSHGPERRACSCERVAFGRDIDFGVQILRDISEAKSAVF